MQAKFLPLANASIPMGGDSEQDEEELLARVDCNAFVVTDADSLLFRIAPRSNHSCIPNVDYSKHQKIRERFIGFLVTLVTLGWVGHPTAAGGGLGDLCGVGGW